MASCSDALPSLPSLPDLPTPPVPDILKPERTIDQPKTFIERALSNCPKRIEAGETACLKTAVADQHLSAAALAALIPSCGRNQICHYDYTTIDRVGYLPVTESNFVAHWRATFDFTKRPVAAGDVPIKVVVE